MSFFSYFIETQALAHDTIRMDNARTKTTLKTIQELLGLPSDVTLSIINHYKDIFNAPHQHVLLEKNRQALILAKRTSPFLLPGSDLCQKFGSDLFYYAQLALNCPFNCSYCFLQGLYRTGHCVLFINYKKFLTELSTLVKAHPGSMLYIPLTHETDLLAFKEGRNLLKLIIPELSRFPHVQFEIRTKSAVHEFFHTIPAISNVTYAFSLAPQEIISAYEQKTPELNARLSAIQACIREGHTVRLCFDPVFIEPDALTLYNEFFLQVFTTIPSHMINDVSYGFFRMPKKLFRYCAGIHRELYLYHGPYETEGDDIGYPAALRETMRREHASLLENYFAPEKIFFLD